MQTTTDIEPSKEPTNSNVQEESGERILWG